ncbi:EamA family transporter [Candidatus Parcubacteria bacterium]|nr:EamA family transporter [Candidatus Parcubacteria bacterium]
MNWFLIALIGPALWALVNHIDKYIISKYFTGRGVGSLVLFTSLSGLLISLVILILDFSQVFISPLGALVIAINGGILVAAFIPYLYALENEEASWASSLYQLIPVFGYVLGFVFLRERLTTPQLFASLLVIIGAVAISLDLSQKIKLKAKPFWLMILSSFMIALNALIFKVVALDQNFWGTAFWEYIGGGVFGLLLFTLIPLYREQFIATVQRGRKAVLTVNLVSELLNIGAKLAANFASLLAPLALVWVVNGFQPFIVFIYGVILTLFMPRFGKEDISKRVVIQKLSAMAVMLVGICFLFK